MIDCGVSYSCVLAVGLMFGSPWGIRTPSPYGLQGQAAARAVLSAILRRPQPSFVENEAARNACKYLGSHGSLLDQPVLMKVVTSNLHYIIRADAAEALGRVGDGR